MTSKIKELGKRFLEWYKTNSDEREEEQEFEEFLEKVEKRTSKIHSVQKASTHETRAQVALMFENAYTQKKMIETNESLKVATWILAMATIAFTVGTIYGVEKLNKTGKIGLQILLVLIILRFITFILEGAGNFLKFIFKLIKK